MPPWVNMATSNACTKTHAQAAQQCKMQMFIVGSRCIHRAFIMSEMHSGRAKPGRPAVFPQYLTSTALRCQILFANAAQHVLQFQTSQDGLLLDRRSRVRPAFVWPVSKRYPAPRWSKYKQAAHTAGQRQHRSCNYMHTPERDPHGLKCKLPLTSSHMATLQPTAHNAENVKLCQHGGSKRAAGRV